MVILAPGHPRRSGELRYESMISFPADDQQSSSSGRLLACLCACLVFLSGFAGCNRRSENPPPPPEPPVPQTKTLETSRLGTAIDLYERSATAENHADVKKAFAELDGEIAELEALVAQRSGGEREEAAVKLKNLQTYRAKETLRFTAAEAAAKTTR